MSDLTGTAGGTASGAMACQVVDVERLLVWTYQTCQAHNAVRVGLYEGERAASRTVYAASSGDGCATVAEQGRLGCRVDVSGARTDQLNEDAERVHQLVMMLESRALLIRHGRAGTRPEGFDIPDPHLEPVWKDLPRYDSRGLPAPRSFELWTDQRRHAIGCPLQLSEAVEYVEVMREEFRIWRAGLVALAEALAHTPLRRFRVTGPAVPSEPIGGKSKTGLAIRASV